MLVAGDGLGFTALFVFTGRKSSSEAVSPVMGSFPVSCRGCGKFSSYIPIM